MLEAPAPLATRERWLSAAEFLVGAFIVVGHNVFRIVPNEVPILAAMGLLSGRFRSGKFFSLGLERPRSWPLTVLIAAGVAVLRIALGEFLILPVASRFWPAPMAPAGAAAMTGNLKMALLGLLLVWTFAAFGEEFGYRGYLLNRCAEAGNKSKVAYWLAVLAVSILFGFGHYYKGPAGILDSGVAGLLLGCAFLLSGRNLWACILAHGFIDTLAVAATYFGWNS